MRKATKYEYPMSGGYADTLATMEDGRKVYVNTQYKRVLPLGKHADDCDQINVMGGRCTCGLLDGIDEASLIADAHERGLFGSPPEDDVSDDATDNVDHGQGWCDRCESYCFGDCG